MKTLTVIYFKPKPKHFNEYLEALKKISLNIYISSRDNEICHVFLDNSIEVLAYTRPEDLGCLDQHRRMLQEYLSEDGHGRPYTAFIEHEPSISMGNIKQHKLATKWA